MKPEFSNFEGLWQLLEQPGTRLVMLIGGADSGKTTLIETLARRLCQSLVVGVVDADIGQSHVGLPGTVGWGRAGRDFSGWDSVEPESFYFTGAVSPAGNLLPVVVGTRLMADMALAACEKVFVDTTGLIAGGAGTALKQMKIDLLRPDLIVALERDDELGHILGAYSFHELPGIIRLPVAPEARATSPSKRARFRRERYRVYFESPGAADREFSLDRVALRFTRGEATGPAGLEGRLASLRGHWNDDLALGVIKAVDARAGTMLVRTRLAATEPVTTIVVGSIEAGR